MSLSRLSCLVLGVFLLATSAAAQEAAVLRKHHAAIVNRPIAAMRHVGARTRPAMPATATPVVASVSRARTVRSLPVHFRH